MDLEHERGLTLHPGWLGGWWRCLHLPQSQPPNGLRGLILQLLTLKDPPLSNILNVGTLTKLLRVLEKDGRSWVLFFVPLFSWTTPKKKKNPPLGPEEQQKL